MRIALDAMGGDHAPGPIVRGAIEAVQKHEQLSVVLVGDEAQVVAALGEHCDHPRLTRFHCSQVISMEEKPAALRTKPDSSIARCWELMATRRVDAIVSAGNTGAVTAGGLFSKLYLKGIKRPGIAVVIPTLRGPTVLLDVGANANAKPEHLFQYGVMGAIYARTIVGIDSPTVGLMNIGTEDGKGNDLAKETHQVFRASHLKDRFLGNVEGRDLYQGTANVVVTDGFVGNVVLKVSESMFEFVLKMVVGALEKSLGDQKAAALQTIQGLADKHHHSSYGGALLLGIDGTCIICHGSSNETSIRNALLRTAQYVSVHLNDQIVRELELASASVPG